MTGDSSVKWERSLVDKWKCSRKKKRKDDQKKKLIGASCESNIKADQKMY